MYVRQECVYDNKIGMLYFVSKNTKSSFVCIYAMLRYLSYL